VKPAKPFWVSLRQALTIHDFDAQVPLLVRACQDFGVDEVLFFTYDIDLNHPATGFWPLETIAAHARQLAVAKKELEAVGVKVGINVYTSLGGDRGRQMSRLYPFQPLVNQDGGACTACACPLDEAWREYYRQATRLWGSIKPYRYFIDDDFRWVNHGRLRRPGIAITCFCPKHLAEFERRYGRKYTREELLADFLQPGKPHPTRAQWLEMQRDIFEKTAAMIEAAMHEVSPETEVGLMCSPPDVHALDGRDWMRLLRAFAGEGKPLLLRPHFPPYDEGALRNVPISLLTARQTVAQFPPDAPITHFVELDNCLPTAFNRSPDYIAFQTMAWAALGQAHVHYSLFEFTGNRSVYEDGKEYGEMLRALRPCVERILSWTDGPRRDTGVGLIDNARYAYTRPVPAGTTDYWSLRANTQAMANGLQLLGYPVTFEPSPVIAPPSGVLQSFDDERLRELLGKNLLLDITAAEVFIERGFGALIGVDGIERPVGMVVGAERTDDGEYMHNHLFEVTPDRILKPAPNARVLSQQLAPLHKPLGPGTMLFENKLGGRIAIINAQANIIDSLVHLCPQRQRLMGRVLEFLFGDALQMRVRELPLCLPLLSVHRQHVLAVAGNVRSSAGRQAQIQLRGAGLTDRVEALLFAEGKLEPVSVTVQPPGADGWWTYRMNAPIPPLGMVFLKITT